MANICENILVVDAQELDPEPIYKDIFGHDIEDEVESEIDLERLVPYPPLFNEYAAWKRERRDTTFADRDVYFGLSPHITSFAKNLAGRVFINEMVDVKPAIDPYLMMVISEIGWDWLHELGSVSETLEAVNKQFEQRPGVDEFTTELENQLQVNQGLSKEMSQLIAQTTNYLLRLGVENEISLRNTLYGTKWVNPGSISTLKRGNLVHHFNSPWSGPDLWFEVLVEKYPSARFYLRSFEPGNQLSVICVGENGQVKAISGDITSYQDEDGELLYDEDGCVSETYVFDSEDFEDLDDPFAAKEATAMIGAVVFR